LYELRNVNPRLWSPVECRAREDAQYAHDPEYLYDAAHVVELVRVRLVGLGHQYQRHVVRQYGQQVDHV